MYLKAQDTYVTADTLGRLQENARHAMGLVEADVRMANFWGLHNQPDFIATNALSTFPANCGADWVTDVASFVTGENNAYSLPCAASGGGAQSNADVLIVRRASAQRISPQSASVAAVNRDRVLIVSNPLAGEIFVPQDIGDSIPAGYATADPANAPPLADTRELLVNAYYVSRNSSVATGYPALRRKRLSAGPSITDEELLPGVEDLQFEIGVDTDWGCERRCVREPGCRACTAARRSRFDCGCACARRIATTDSQTLRPYAYADRSWPATNDGYRRFWSTRPCNCATSVDESAMTRALNAVGHGRHQRGAALIIATMLLLVVTVLGVAGLVAASLELQMSGNLQYQERAFQAAEFAIEQALHSAPTEHGLHVGEPEDLSDVWRRGATCRAPQPTPTPTACTSTRVRAAHRYPTDPTRARRWSPITS